MWIILALVAIPIIEIALFIEVGGWVGLWPTLALIVVTAVIGGVLLRQQGFSAMRRMQTALAEGGDPSGPMVHGILILLAGLLMLTPGFFTDAVGFALLIPPLRSALIAALGPWLTKRMVTQRGMGAQWGATGAAGHPRQPGTEAPIDADYVDLSDIGEVGGEGEAPRARRSGWTNRPDDGSNR